jgi:hypothetical protein
MQAFSTFIGIIFSLALLAAFLFGGYFLFEYVADLFILLEPQIKAIVVIVSIVIVLCAMIIAGGLRGRSQKQNESSSAIGKTTIYQQLLIYWSERLTPKVKEKQLIKDSELIKLELELALHGSPEVITAYMNFRRLAKQGEKTGDEVYLLLNKLALEMREDLGRVTLNLKENDLLDLLLGGCPRIE